MRSSSRFLCAGVLSVAFALLSAPALAQWYDDEEAPAGEGEILAPFTFKDFNLKSGVQLSSWYAPGEDILGATCLLRGGYAFDSAPIYLGLEIPVSWGQVEESPGNFDSELALGAIGINLKHRVDPDKAWISIFTGWSLDLYIPTFMGDVTSQTRFTSLAHQTGLSNTLLPAIHMNPEAISLVGSFDLILPGHWIFIQFELSAAVYFPVTDMDQRKIEGGLAWGVIAGLNIAEPIAFLLEFKSYVPLGAEDTEGNPRPSSIAISPGFRMELGAFKPAVWVSFPLDKDYRNAWPDVIFGLDLAAWF